MYVYVYVWEHIHTPSHQFLPKQTRPHFNYSWCTRTSPDDGDVDGYGYDDGDDDDYGYGDEDNREKDEDDFGDGCGYIVGTKTIPPEGV